MSDGDARLQEAHCRHQADEDQKAIAILTEARFAEDVAALHLFGQIYFLADKATTGVGRSHLGIVGEARHQATGAESVFRRGLPR